ncbi:MAG: hypothetical protein ABI435_03490 [Pseudolysinimonas sp.]
MYFPDLTLPFIVALIGGILALVDGVVRVRRGVAILAVLEILASALFLLSLFVANVPFGSPLLALITLILLVIAIAFSGGTHRGGVAVTVIAIILLIVWLVLIGGKIVIPGVPGLS